MPTGLCNDAIYKTPRERTLCTQIAAEQPLALALVQGSESLPFQELGAQRYRLIDIPTIP